MKDAEYDRLLQAELQRVKRNRERAAITAAIPPYVPKQDSSTYMGRTPCKVYFDCTSEPPVRIQLEEHEWIWPT